MTKKFEYEAFIQHKLKNFSLRLRAIRLEKASFEAFADFFLRLFGTSELMDMRFIYFRTNTHAQFS
jgi:hypothetical protein